MVPAPLHDRDGKIWMDGELVEWRDAKIHVLTHTLHYGCGAFEGVRAYNTVNGPAIFRLEEHTDPPVQQRQDLAHEYSIHARNRSTKPSARSIQRANKPGRAATCAP